MMTEIEQAEKEVNELFNSLKPIADDIVKQHSKEIDDLIKILSKAETLSNSELRGMMLLLSIAAYMFGSAKDQSVLRQECATALYKENLAREFNAADGTQAAKTNTATVNSTDKQVVNLLYNAVANLMKTKLDETHRVINTLNSILISRNAEAKLANANDEMPVNI